MKRIFKETSFLGKLENLFYVLWEKESLRFVFVGGINTLLGIITSILINLFFVSKNVTTEFGFWFMEFDVPNLISFIGLLPIAYTMQALIAFRSEWEWKRLAVYPLTTIPNLFLQQTGIYLFKQIIDSKDIVYVLSALAVLPIMFFIIRFFVKPLKSRKKPDQVIQDSEQTSD